MMSNLDYRMCHNPVEWILQFPFTISVIIVIFLSIMLNVATDTIDTKQ